MSKKRNNVFKEYIYVVLRVHHEDCYKRADSDADILGTFRQEEHALECALQDISDNCDLDEDEQKLKLFFQARKKKNGIKSSTVEQKRNMLEAVQNIQSSRSGEYTMKPSGYFYSVETCFLQ